MVSTTPVVNGGITQPRVRRVNKMGCDHYRIRKPVAFLPHRTGARQSASPATSSGPCTWRRFASLWQPLDCRRILIPRALAETLDHGVGLFRPASDRERAAHEHEIIVGRAAVV